MSPNLRIALRFLTAKKRAMLMSLSRTVLGVGLFVLTQATTSGFEEFFIKTILGTDGAVDHQDAPSRPGRDDVPVRQDCAWRHEEPGTTAQCPV